jgi:PAS domain S-box-containing protein/putative nucleotidyltransferase with HDIG domain
MEDNPLDADLLLHVLHRDGLDFTWQRVETRQEYLAHLDPPPDIILADYTLPQFDAPEALRLLQERGLDIPFIVVSGTIGEDTAVDCMRDGATDYLLKDRLGRLGAAVRQAVEAKRLRDGQRADEAARHQAEEDRRQSEEQYRQIVETAHEGIWLVDSRLRITFANARMAEMLGYPVEEMLGASVYAFVDQEEHDRLDRRVERRREGIREEVEVRYRRKDGTPLWLLASATSFFDVAGHYAGALGMYTDITARKQAEEAVQRQLAYLSSLKKIDTAIISSLDVGLTLSVILEQTTRHLGVDSAIVLTLNPHLHILEHAASHGFRGAAVRILRLRLGEGHAGRAALERRLISVPDLAQEPLGQADLVAAEGFVSYWAVPLVAKGNLKGVLCLLHRAPLTPDQEWQGFLSALAQQAAIAIDNAALFEGLQRTTLDLAVAYDSTIEGWSRALDLRDQETQGHSRRVTEMTLSLARALGLSDEELVHVRRGALLHDIGKMGIPDAILLKPGPLTEQEWTIMRWHPTLAYQLLQPITYLWPALDIPYRHHEKWDGSGYPQGLKGAQIPLAARAFAVVDVWDALTSDRPYRPAWSWDRTFAHIRAEAGHHFDPAVVEVFLALQAKW